MRRLALLALLPLFALSATRARGQDVAGRTRVETAHYVLTIDGEQAEADELGRVLEAAWPLFAEYFGAAPKLGDDERLQIQLHANDAGFRAAITAGGGVAPSSGGYYCPKAKTSYLKRQPSRWYTRNLLLHEASHQFHYLSRTGNDAPHGNWYVEGTAEHLGSHMWDGETLRIGVTPVLSLEDRAGNALTEIGAADFSLAELLDAPTASRPAAMFFLRYLREGNGGKHRKKLASLSKKLDRGSRVGAKAIFKTFGKESRLLSGLREWLQTVQEPLRPVFLEWDSCSPDRVIGRAGVVSTCRTRLPAQSIAATLHPPETGPFKAGLLLEHTGPRDYVVALFSGRDARPSAVQVDRMRAGKWDTLHRGAIDAAGADGGGFRLGVTRADDGTLAVTVGGNEVHRHAPASPTPGPLGLAIDSCEVDFSALAIEPTPAPPNTDK